MNKNHVYRKKEVKSDILEDVVVPNVLDRNDHNNMYKIVGIIDGHYVVQTPKGLKKVKIYGTDKKDISDEIKIEKL
jgi:hypothetical protein